MVKTRSITTKTGDKGTTRLFSGQEVLKNSPRIEAYGDVDELVSILSIARHHITHKDLEDDIIYIQRCLFVVGSELATTNGKLSKLPRRVDEKFLKEIEEKRERLEKAVSIPRGFVIPGNTLSAAYLDYARAVARRCERKVVGLFEAKVLQNEILIVWLNRLSDYLYLLSRTEEDIPLMVKENQ